jgi:hypothetical protein
MRSQLPALFLGLLYKASFQMTLNPILFLTELTASTMTLQNKL